MDNKMFYYIIAIVLSCIIAVLFAKPLGKLFKIIVNSALGGVFIIVFNFISQLFGFFIGINAITAFTVGILGIPGFLMLVMLQLIVN